MRTPCLIQWIDAKGEPTPDTNDAAVWIQLHEDPSPHTGYQREIGAPIPCCLKHLVRMPTDGRWKIVGMPRDFELVAIRRTQEVK